MRHEIDLEAEIQYQESVYRDRADEWFKASKRYQREHPNRFDAIVFTILIVIGFLSVSGVFYWVAIIGGFK